MTFDILKMLLFVVYSRSCLQSGVTYQLSSCLDFHIQFYEYFQGLWEQKGLFLNGHQILHQSHNFFKRVLHDNVLNCDSEWNILRCGFPET